jgi:hypothetical protein
MTVVARPRDADGAALLTRITNLTATANALAAGPAKDAANAQLDQAQREAVIHFLNVGRITAANVLSTLT